MKESGIWKDEINQYTVLIVDDSPVNITLFSGLLKEFYNIRVALNGEKALKMVALEPPDLILLDVVMPVMDGYETCRRLKENDNMKDIPIIFLTAKTDADAESVGLELGAVDYITKPVNQQIFLSRIRAHLSAKLSTDLLKERNKFLGTQNQYLEEEVERRTKEITELQEITILAMSSLAETRDNETGNHLKRTKLYAKEICERLSKTKNYSKVLDRNTINKIVTAVPLHDIGKVGIPDSILLKPGKLTEEEFEIMKTHTTLGKESIEKAELMVNCPEDFLKIPKEIVYGHHEKWNGTGYPKGLAGTEIPLSARIVALVDVYDALRSERVYKPALTHNEVIKIIVSESGKHFSSDVVDAFLEVNELFEEISNKHKDGYK